MLDYNHGLQLLCWRFLPRPTRINMDEVMWTDHSREKFQSGELGCGEGNVGDQLGDGDEAEVHQEREDVEHEEPLEEQEVGEDARSKLATDLLHVALP